MNNNKFGVIFLAGGALLVSVIVILSVLSGSGNIISATLKYFLIAVCVFGLVKPKSGMYILVVLALSLDFIKRVMVFGGAMNFSDVALTLAVAPILMMCITIGTVLGRFFRGGRRAPFTKIEFTSLLFASVAVVLVTILSVVSAGGLGLGAMANIANGAAYILMAGVAGIVFPERDQQIKFLNFSAVMMTFCVIYGLAQAVHGGPFDFEIDYLLLGYSSTIAILDTLTFRPFGTLNSATALWAIALLGLSFAFYRMRESRAMKLFWIVAILAFLALPVVGAIRTAMAASVIAIASQLVYGSKKLTILMYSVSGFLFLNLVIFIDFVESNLGAGTQLLRSGLGSTSEWQQRATTLLTFTERVKSIKGWSRDADMWTLFGHDALSAAGSDALVTHDLIGQLLFRYGAVPLVFVVLLVSYTAIKLHKKIFQIADPKDKRLASYYAGVIFTLVFAALITGDFLRVFPVNLFLWINVGFLLKLIYKEKQLEPTIAKAKVNRPLGGQRFAKSQ